MAFCSSNFFLSATLLLVAATLSSGIDLKCRFEDYSYIWGTEEYTCNVTELEIVEVDIPIQKVVGDHHEGKSNYEVLQVFIDELTVNYLPAGVAHLFPNLKAFIVQDSGLRRVERSNFRNMHSLNALLLSYNKLAEIPGDTFADLAQLEFLSLAMNQLTALSDRSFGGLAKLKRLHLHENLLERIENSTFSSNENLEVIWLQGNKLKFISAAFLMPVRNPTEVFLGSNVCIHSWFPGPTSLKGLIEEVAERCKEMEGKTEVEGDEQS